MDDLRRGRGACLYYKVLRSLSLKEAKASNDYWTTNVPMMVYNCVKLHENISSCFQVIEQTKKQLLQYIQRNITLKYGGRVDGRAEVFKLCTSSDDA